MGEGWEVAWRMCVFFCLSLVVGLPYESVLILMFGQDRWWNRRFCIWMHGWEERTTL